MNKKIKKIFLLFLAIILISCKKSTRNSDSLKETVKTTLGTKLVLSENIYLYKPFKSYKLDSIKIKNADFKIYSLINASCGDCINKINNWEIFSKELNNYEIPIILIFRSNDNFELLKNMLDMNKVNPFPYPFLFDYKNELIKSNRFMEESDSFMTILTDNNNSILLMGDPLNSEKIKTLYLNKIQKNN